MKLDQIGPEQWFLTAAFIGLAILSGVIALLLPTAKDVTVIAGGKSVKEYSTESLEKATEAWEANPSLEIADHQVFVSRLIVYKPESESIEYLDPESEVNGIRVSWLLERGYSLEDKGVAASDEDQDGFTTKEEYVAGTEPKKFNSHPPFVLKLCLKDYEYIAFRLIFRGYSPNASGNLVYQINLRDAKTRRSRLVREGEDIEGYKIGEFRKIIQEKMSPTTGIVEQKDLSELDIINPKLNETITLVLNEEKDANESRGEFDLRVPNINPEPASMQRGDKFTIDGVEFQLTQVAEGGATIIRN